ncbi:MAG TPA: nucleotidyl transferase AbiEii/AbiGii toxin family protein [Alphaproteobacteria bacterium]|nr:nucleotidyl transferase AbiEii/AbiGii toxin family protein [Alphaproteobacteria bacterium]
MNPQDFNQLVERAMRKPGLTAMRPVVEKEILHYDIFQALDAAGLLKGLVFQGGTSLRLCRGSQRFSEDLDFAGGKEFAASNMANIKDCLEEHIGSRYGLNVDVTGKPARKRDEVKVDKWQVSVETTPGNRHMPRQKIKVEVAAVPAYTSELLPLRTNYEFLEGYPSVLVLAETVSEVMADKVLAFPAALGARVRHRDIWDLAWLTQQGASLDPDMVLRKAGDYGIENYQELLDRAIAQIPEIVRSKPFKDQMQRFIDRDTFAARLGDERFLDYLISAVGGIFKKMKTSLSASGPETPGAFRI